MKQTMQIRGIVNVGARKDGHELTLNEKTGQIVAACFQGEKVTSMVTTARGSNLVVFTGRKGFVPTPVTGTETNGRQVYELPVEMKANEHGIFHVSFYQGNSLRYLAVDRFGAISITETSIVVGLYKLYSTKQEIYSAQLYKDGRKIICSHPLSEWTEMVEFATTAFEEQNGPMAVSLLPEIGEMKPQPQEPTNLSSNEGIVKFYSIARGVGAVYTAKGLVKIHFSQVKTNSGLPQRIVELKPGQALTFKGLRTPKGESEFAHEIVEATLVEA